MYVKTGRREMYLKLIGKRTCSITLLFAHNTINEGCHDIAMTYSRVLDKTKQLFVGNLSCHWQNEKKIVNLCNVSVIYRWQNFWNIMYLGYRKECNILFPNNVFLYCTKTSRVSFNSIYSSISKWVSSVYKKSHVSQKMIFQIVDVRYIVNRSSNRVYRTKQNWILSRICYRIITTLILL